MTTDATKKLHSQLTFFFVLLSTLQSHSSSFLLSPSKKGLYHNLGSNNLFLLQRYSYSWSYGNCFHEIFQVLQLIFQIQNLLPYQHVIACFLRSQQPINPRPYLILITIQASWRLTLSSSLQIFFYLLLSKWAFQGFIFTFYPSLDPFLFYFPSLEALILSFQLPSLKCDVFHFFLGLEYQLALFSMYLPHRNLFSFQMASLQLPFYLIFSDNSRSSCRLKIMKFRTYLLELFQFELPVSLLPYLTLGLIHIKIRVWKI